MPASVRNNSSRLGPVGVCRWPRHNCRATATRALLQWGCRRGAPPGALRTGAGMSGRFGKPDVTGRSSGTLAGRHGKVMRPPPGEPFIWLTREVIESDAWRSLGINARRFIDFLLLDQMNNAG